MLFKYGFLSLNSSLNPIQNCSRPLHAIKNGKHTEPVNEEKIHGFKHILTPHTLENLGFRIIFH